jgi:hypothetical protein
MHSTTFSPTMPVASAPHILAGSAHERAAAIAQRCGGGRERHGTWTVCCPAHEDHHPSLTVTPADDKVLVHCRAGCETQTVLQAIGLTWCDVFDHGLKPMPLPKRPTHLGPRIPEPPGGPTPQNIALQVALELLVDDVKLLEVEAVQVLFCQAAVDLLTRLWIEQQLRRHHLDPDTVWRIVQAPTRTVTAGVRTFGVTPSQGAFACPAK